MKNKKWIIGEYDTNVINSLSSSLSVSPLCAKLLCRRGYSTEDDAKDFLKKDISGFHSPFLMKDMEKSTTIIKKAHSQGLKTLIWGDYDVDGVTASTIMLKYFKSLGFNVDYYIPRRLDEGYGLNKDAIDCFAKSGGRFLITVDCGITADEEIAYAKSLGIIVIVTDHHECRSTLPPADAVINPKRHDCAYPFKELAGVGVAFKLICACEIVFKNISHVEALKNVLSLCADLTAIGTIADVMPIIDENRLIVNRGLLEISHTENLGLDALIDEAGINSKSYKKRKISSTTIGFVLAPKINAAGRMGTSRSAVDLFLTDSREKAAELANELTSINKTRQILENDILNEAVKKIERDFDFENEKIIILADDDWHHGVIGIVASRITEKYNLPAILISFKNEGHEMLENLGKGSGRSIRGFNLVEALGKCSDILLKYGGHELAAGLSVDRCNFNEFKHRMNEYATEAFSSISPERLLEVDCEVSSTEINVDTVNEISMLEPFGLSNPVPMFYTSGMTVVSIIPIGENKHTKLILKKDSKTFVALFFGRPQNTLSLLEGDVIDVVYNLDINNFKNQQTVQLILRDIRYSNDVSKKIDAAYSRYIQIKSNNSVSVRAVEIPTRDDFRAIYTLLKTDASSISDDEFEVDIPLYARLAQKRFGVDVSVCKAFLIFDVLAEAGILACRQSHTDDYLRIVDKNVFIDSASKKVELTLTRLMQNLISRKIN